MIFFHPHCLLEYNAYYKDKSNYSWIYLQMIESTVL